MAVPQLAVAATAAQRAAADVLVLAVRSAEEGPALVGVELPELDLASDRVHGCGRATPRGCPAPASRPGPSCSSGSARSIDADGLRAAAADAVRRLAGSEHVALALPADDDAALAAVLEGAALGAYAYTAYRQRTLAAQKTPVGRVTVLGRATADDARCTARPCSPTRSRS